MKITYEIKKGKVILNNGGVYFALSVDDLYEVLSSE